MIDFQNELFLRLHPVDDAAFSAMAAPLLVPDEQILHAFQSGHDGILFTNKRILAVNRRGIGSKKTAFTTLPYGKIQAYSLETTGTLAPEVELDLWFSAMGRVHFEFEANTDIAALYRTISAYIL